MNNQSKHKCRNTDGIISFRNKMNGSSAIGFEMYYYLSESRSSSTVRSRIIHNVSNPSIRDQKSMLLKATKRSLSKTDLRCT